MDMLTLDNGYVPAVSTHVAHPRVPANVTFMQAHVDHQRVSGVAAMPPGPPVISLTPNLAERYGLDDVQSYDLPVVARVAALWGAYGSPADNFNPFYLQAPRAHQALDTFAVRYVVAPHRSARPLVAAPCG